jgi:hypothetical protein
MRVQVANTHAHLQRLVSVLKMATELEEYNTEEQRSVGRFCGQEDSVQRIFIKKYFLFTVGSVCRVKRFITGSGNFADDEEVKTEVRKRLRQQSKDFDAAGIDALIKRWDKCINVSGGYVFLRSNIKCFTFYINFFPIY